MNIFRRRSKKGQPSTREAPNLPKNTASQAWDSGTGSSGGSFGDEFSNFNESPLDLQYELRSNPEVYANILRKGADGGSKSAFEGSDRYSFGTSTTLAGSQQHNKAYERVHSISPAVGASTSPFDDEGSDPKLQVTEISRPSDPIAHYSSLSDSILEKGSLGPPIASPVLDPSLKDPIASLCYTAQRWLFQHRRQILGDHQISSQENFQDFLNCAYTVYEAGKSGWDASTVSDLFASAIDQTSDPNFRSELMQKLLQASSLQNNDIDPEAPGSSESSTTILAAMASSPMFDAAADSQGAPSIFSKDIFLDWHSKFAFSSPIQLGTKEILPTIQLPAVVGSSEITKVETAQERQSAEPEPSIESKEPVMETPHLDEYQTHPGLFQLGKNLYERHVLSDSPLNTHRSTESGPSRPIQRASTMEMLDDEEEYAIYGNDGLKDSIMRGEITNINLPAEPAPIAPESSVEVLAPWVQTAVMEGQYHVVVELMKRNPACFDIAMATAEKNGKFAFVKYLDMWKQHYRSPPNLPQNPISGFPGAGKSFPMAGNPDSGKPKPKKIDEDFGRSSFPAGMGRSERSLGSHLPSADYREPSPQIQSDDDSSQTTIDDDVSEELSKLRAIYLLILMVVLSETTSSEGWDSNSTTSSSLQSFQSPSDAGEYNGSGASGAGGRPVITTSGLRMQGGGGGGGPGGGRRGGRGDGGEDDGDNNQRRPPNRRTRGDLRSLGGRYACPYAKAEPDMNVTCWAINRQNLAGVKEHIKRFHFKGTLPSDIRGAKTWFDVFDCIAPDWGNRKKPSPYVDMFDIYQRALVPTTTQGNDSVSERSAAASQQWNQQQQARASSMATAPQPTLTTAGVSGFSSQYAPGGSFTQDVGNLSLYTPVTADPVSRRPSGAVTPGSASVAGYEGVTYPMIPQTMTTTASQNPPTQPTISNSLYTLANELGPPHFTGLATDNLASEYAGIGDYFRDEFGIDNSEPAPMLYTNIMNSMEAPVPVNPAALRQPNPVHQQLDFPDPVWASASSDDTILALTQAPTQASHPAPSIGSSSGPSISGPSLYPSSSTSINMHYLQAPPPVQAFSPPSLTPQSTQPTNHSSPGSILSAREKTYTLQVQRFPPLPSTEISEGRGTFRFDSFEEFRRDFDTWMSYQFTDPMFNWENWELSNPSTKRKLPSTTAVESDLNFTFLAFRDNSAALFLVQKEYGSPYNINL